MTIPVVSKEVAVVGNIEAIQLVGSDERPLIVDPWQVDSRLKWYQKNQKNSVQRTAPVMNSHQERKGHESTADGNRIWAGRK
jgi:hypothetical protein